VAYTVKGGKLVQCLSSGESRLISTSDGVCETHFCKSQSRRLQVSVTSLLSWDFE